MFLGEVERQIVGSVWKLVYILIGDYGNNFYFSFVNILFFIIVIDNLIINIVYIDFLVGYLF